MGTALERGISSRLVINPLVLCYLPVTDYSKTANLRYYQLFLMMVLSLFSHRLTMVDNGLIPPCYVLTLVDRDST